MIQILSINWDLKIWKFLILVLSGNSLTRGGGIMRDIDVPLGDLGGTGKRWPSCPGIL